MSAALVVSGIAWALALGNIWGYGRSVRLGAIIGLGCASTFMLLAWMTGDPFMAAANAAFFALHCWNLWQAHVRERERLA